MVNSSFPEGQLTGAFCLKGSHLRAHAQLEQWGHTSNAGPIEVNEPGKKRIVPTMNQMVALAQAIQESQITGDERDKFMERALAAFSQGQL